MPGTPNRTRNSTNHIPLTAGRGDQRSVLGLVVGRGAEVQADGLLAAVTGGKVLAAIGFGGGRSVPNRSTVDCREKIVLEPGPPPM